MRPLRTALACALLLPLSLLAANDPAQLRDLTAVIALQGLPCGEVTSYEVKGDRDFLATCKDGNKYRVFVNAEGRVVVRKA
jgi:hypothetical protein